MSRSSSIALSIHWSTILWWSSESFAFISWYSLSHIDVPNTLSELRALPDNPDRIRSCPWSCWKVLHFCDNPNAIIDNKATVRFSFSSFLPLECRSEVIASYTVENASSALHSTQKRLKSFGSYDSCFSLFNKPFFRFSIADFKFWKGFSSWTGSSSSMSWVYK